MKALKVTFVIYLVIQMVAACSRSSVLLQPSSDQPGPYYTSTFPYVDVSLQLEDIHGSIFKISTSSIYTHYYFDDPLIAETSLDSLRFAEAATRVEGFTKEQNGTAVVIAKNDDTLFLLTNRSIIDVPDTLIIRGDQIPGGGLAPIRQITVVSKNFNIAIQQPFMAQFEVLSYDDHFALLKIQTESPLAETINPLKIRLGNTELLKHGTFIYLLGYPQGQAMAERGIVSMFEQEKPGTFFYTDALFNEGNDGSLLIASRDNFQTFELVGIAVAPATTQDFLIPDYGDGPLMNFQSYFGKYRLIRRPDFAYGVTRAVSSEAIAGFLAENAFVSMNDSSLHMVTAIGRVRE